MLKGYYKNRDEYPWHLIYKDIRTYWDKARPQEDVSECLILLREAVFGALDILSFGLISEISTMDVLELLTSESSWNAGRRKVRNLCIDRANELITKGQVRFLLPTALARDEFGFLVPKIEDAQLRNFIDARPRIARKKLDLSKLEASILGSKFLREQMIMETKLEAEDARVSSILDAFDLHLVEIEVDRRTRTEPPASTEQITLNGEIVQEGEEEREVPAKKRRKKEDVIPLTEFLEKSRRSKARKDSTSGLSEKQTGRMKRK